VGPRAVLDAEKNSHLSPGIEPQNSDHPLRSLVAMPTALSRLLPKLSAHANVSGTNKIVTVMAAAVLTPVLLSCSTAHGW
jgi:hypothetical protein